MSALTEIIEKHAQVVRNHPNAIGELLRAWAFVGDGYGCYSTFDIRPEFKSVEPTAREFAFLCGRDFDPADTEPSSWGYCDAAALKCIRWFRHPNGIEMGWHWDGDGILAFYVPELVDDECSGVVRNDDCKKDNEWEFGWKERA